MFAALRQMNRQSEWARETLRQLAVSRFSVKLTCSGEDCCPHCHEEAEENLIRFQAGRTRPGPNCCFQGN
jgi:hypothetical protein